MHQEKTYTFEQLPESLLPEIAYMHIIGAAKKTNTSKGDTAQLIACFVDAMREAQPGVVVGENTNGSKYFRIEESAVQALKTAWRKRYQVR